MVPSGAIVCPIIISYQQRFMIIYQVVAETARIDYGSRSETESKGFYLNEVDALNKVAEIKSYNHWYMDYETVEVVPVEVIE